MMLVASLFLATGAMAQQQPSPEDLKPAPVLPKMQASKPVAGPAQVTDEDVLYLDLSTGGRVAILMRPDIAPKHVERIRTLVRQHFYDGLTFHRVIDGFMAQGGDPLGTGQGGSKLPDLKAEFNDLPHVRGAVAMARAQDPDSANSQFYIMLQPTLRLDHQYTVWGRVMSGMEYVDAIEKGEPPANPSRILQASIKADNVPPPAPSTPIPAAEPPAPASGQSLAVPPGETVSPGLAKQANSQLAKKPGKK
jgi:peptidylprolyl isomerase